MRPVGEVVTLIRTVGGGVDPDGYPLPETTERTDVAGTVVEDGGGQLTVQPGGVITSTSMRVLFPRAVDVDQDVTLEIRGDRFRLEGRPFTHSSQWGRHDLGGTVVEVKRGTA